MTEPIYLTMHGTRARPAIPYVADFVGAFKRNLRIVTQADLQPAWWTSRADHGTLLFSEDDLRSYTRVIEQLIGEFARAGDLSRRSVERYLLDTLFEALDLRGRSPDTFEKRLLRAVADLRKHLTKEPVEWLFYLPVEGFSPEELPLLFGRVRFLVFGKAQLQGLRRKAIRRDQFGGAPIGQLSNRPCAAVRVMARDYESAEATARRDVHLALDCLNFLGGTFPYNHAWLRLPGGPGQGVNQFTAGVASDGSGGVSMSVAGSLGHFALKALQSDRRSVRRIRSLGTLLRLPRSKRRTVGEVLLASVASAGRAAAEPSRELSFLLYAIGLEAAVLPEKGEGLAYRLSVRVARLLGDGPQKRETLRRRMAELYRVRSDIVHNASYEVAEKDLRLLRSVTTEVLLRLLRRRSLWSMKHKTLEDEFKRTEMGR